LKDGFNLKKRRQDARYFRAFVRARTLLMTAINLLPIDAELIRLVSSDPAAFATRYGADLGQWLKQAQEVVKGTDALYKRLPRDAPWLGYLVASDERVVVGCCGFVNAPGPASVVEIAYATWPDFQRQGYATAAAAALIEIASKSGVVKCAIAHTLPQENASTRILKRVGMTFQREIDHPEDGKIWLWEKDLVIEKADSC
jgi:RimJ/RimL family protein N-acetyltransferase